MTFEGDMDRKGLYDRTSEGVLGYHPSNGYGLALFFPYINWHEHVSGGTGLKLRILTVVLTRPEDFL